MAEELDHLIEKLQSEAITKAERDAAEIISKAKEKAAQLVKEAEKESETIIADADREAQQYTERSIRTLEQVARDLLISVGQGVENILDDLVRESLDEAMDISVIKDMLTRMAETYMARSDKERRIDLLVSPEDQKMLVKFYAERYRQKLGDSIEIRPDRSISKGFRVHFTNDHAHHDFTKEAIAEALSKYLRPHLADIILKVAREDWDKRTTK